MVRSGVPRVTVWPSLTRMPETVPETSGNRFTFSPLLWALSMIPLA